MKTLNIKLTHSHIMLDRMILDDIVEYRAVFVYNYLFTNSFQEESRKELKDDNYTEFSRGSSELHAQRALLVNYFLRKYCMMLYISFQEIDRASRCLLEICWGGNTHLTSV